MSEWKEVSLGAIAEIIDPHPSHRAPPEVESGVPFVGIGDISENGIVDVSSARQVDPSVLTEHATRYSVQKGDIAYGRVATVGKVIEFKQDGGSFALSPTMALIKPTIGNSEYLTQYLKSKQFNDQLASNVTGTTRTSLGIQLLRKLNVRLPSSEKEAKAIATILDTLDTQIRQTEAIIAKLQQVKQGLLHDLLTRGIDENGQLRPPYKQAPELYKESPLGWIPKEWVIDRLGEAAISSVIGPFGSDLVASDYREEGVPITFVRDVKVQGFIWNSDVYISRQKAKSLKAHEVIPGDVLATKMGLPPCIAAVYPSWMPSGVVTADIIRLRFDCTQHESDWIVTCMNHECVSKQVEMITAGVTRPKVTLRDVRELFIPVPDLQEQQRILERIHSITGEIDFESVGVEKLKKQKSGLMDDLLTGRVRVTELIEQEKQAS